MQDIEKRFFERKCVRPCGAATLGRRVVGGRIGIAYCVIELPDKGQHVGPHDFDLAPGEKPMSHQEATAVIRAEWAAAHNGQEMERPTMPWPTIFGPRPRR